MGIGCVVRVHFNANMILDNFQCLQKFLVSFFGLCVEIYQKVRSNAQKSTKYFLPKSKIKHRVKATKICTLFKINFYSIQKIVDFSLNSTIGKEILHSQDNPIERKGQQFPFRNAFWARTCNVFKNTGKYTVYLIMHMHPKMKVPKIQK